MKFIVEVKLENAQVRKYTVVATAKSEAVDKIKLRLPPKERESCTIQSVTVDHSQLVDDDVHGTFLN